MHFNLFRQQPFKIPGEKKIILKPLENESVMFSSLPTLVFARILPIDRLCLLE